MIDWDNIELGQMPDDVIAVRLNVPTSKVKYERKKRKIRSYRGYLLFQEETACRSMLEAKYDAYLHSCNIPHEHECNLGFGVIADFNVDGVYIEICGMTGYQKYDARLEQKKLLYEVNKVPVRFIYPDEVEQLYSTHSLPIKFRTKRVCSLCGNENTDLIKGVCRRKCYMIQHRSITSDTKVCVFCKTKYQCSVLDSTRTFCSRRCYWDSMASLIDMTVVEERIKAGDSIVSIAKDLNIKPTTLYARVSGLRKDRH